jgi:hypothetical protein
MTATFDRVTKNPVSQIQNETWPSTFLFEAILFEEVLCILAQPTKQLSVLTYMENETQKTPTLLYRVYIYLLASIPINQPI